MSEFRRLPELRSPMHYVKVKALAALRVKGSVPCFTQAREAMEKVLGDSISGANYVSTNDRR